MLLIWRDVIAEWLILPWSICDVYKYFSGFSGISGAEEVLYKYFSGAGEVYLNTAMAVIGAGDAGEVFNLYTLLRGRRRP